MSVIMVVEGENCSKYNSKGHLPTYGTNIYIWPNNDDT